MTYLAPRQGLFAIILLVSFCLQTLLLVISTDQQISKSRALKGEQMVAQLIDESRLSLENKDRVSLSVIANRYTSEQDVTRILIKDNKDDILVPVGNAPMQQGSTIRQIATNGDAVIGSVALTLKDVSKGEIIAMQWPFVVGTMLLHLLLWLIYGYLARPTKEQINALSRDIQDLYRDQYRPVDQRGYDRELERQSTTQATSHSADSQLASDTTDDEIDDTVTNVRKFNVQHEVNEYLRTQQNQEAAGETGSLTDTAKDSVLSASATIDTGKTQASSSHTSKLSATRAVDSVRVQIVFHDEFNMLERLAPAQRLPYLALCTQLFNQAVTELLKQPLLLGVSAMDEAYFEDNGASVMLKADNSHAKVALAGVMLAKLYLMLNKIIHDKHIELSRFALPAKAGVSDEAQAGAMTHLLQSVGKKEQLLILLPNAGLKQISNHIQVHNIMRPTTVYERECAIFDGGNDSLIQRLADVRNAVLMIESEDDSPI
ncbi:MULTISPECIES: hypothetical protein [unclassified Psychrobacter]|uniref:hypothetical protein n=1 Tax=unclassified Psychrobacter TaxID=196806 RepID=UPI0025B4B6CE|nr:MULTISPECIES: hypothetical protein [unclassified Psychrobacter]MDN3453887.1 hypothetical protein [Psychrobacter sp. APC 3350]MDN3503334.1 hypothetical protein [Psychrobacter sp. 5A.1]